MRFHVSKLTIRIINIQSATSSSRRGSWIDRKVRTYSNPFRVSRTIHVVALSSPLLFRTSNTPTYPPTYPPTALNILRMHHSHHLVTGVDVAWGAKRQTAQLLNLGPADLETPELLPLAATEAARRAFILRKRADPAMQPAALAAAVEEYRAMDDGVHPCSMSVFSQYGNYGVTNAAFKRLLVSEMQMHAGLDQFRMTHTYLFARCVYEGRKGWEWRGRAGLDLNHPRSQHTAQLPPTTTTNPQLPPP